MKVLCFGSLNIDYTYQVDPVFTYSIPNDVLIIIKDTSLGKMFG